MNREVRNVTVLPPHPRGAAGAYFALSTETVRCALNQEGQ